MIAVPALAEYPDPPPAAEVIVGAGAEFGDDRRNWQGIPGIERTTAGRLFVVWYSGGVKEGDARNYVLLSTSDDDGRAWSPPRLVVRHDGARCGDPLLWIDPRGRLWLFYYQFTAAEKRRDTCAVRCDDPDAVGLRWSPPQWVAYGAIVFGKPLVRPDGAWLAPFDDVGAGKREARIAERPTGVIASTDEGATWTWRGGASLPEALRNFDEHNLVACDDGGIAMFIRTLDGIYRSDSADDGRTWTKPERAMQGPVTRAHVRRLASGAWLMIYHDAPRRKDGGYSRMRLAAQISSDEGRTWTSPFILDERNEVSYPDAVEAADGRIFVVYDHGRYTAGAKELLVSAFREADVTAGRRTSTDGPWQAPVNRATGVGNIRESPP